MFSWHREETMVPSFKGHSRLAKVAKEICLKDEV